MSNEPKADQPKPSKPRTPEQIRRLSRAVIAFAQAQREVDAEAANQAAKAEASSPKPPKRRSA